MGFTSAEKRSEDTLLQEAVNVVKMGFSMIDVINEV
jgi:hypothetical protein